MIDQALLTLRPKAIWTLNGSDYSGLDWRDTEQTKPTEAEITAEVARLQAEYDNKEYQRQRASAYPSIADQLDKIYHEGIDAWKAEIAAVKQEYPKP
jgi:hypothetical protein